MSLAQLLTQQQEQLTVLQDLLREEQDVLVRGDVDTEALERLAQAKGEPMAALERLESRRYKAQLALGYGEGRAGSERAAHAAGCLALWQEVQDLGRRTAYLNELNGTLINSRMTHNQRVLETLRRMAGNPTYGADGQPRKDRNRLQLQA